MGKLNQSQKRYRGPNIRTDLITFFRERPNQALTMEEIAPAIRAAVKVRHGREIPVQEATIRVAIANARTQNGLDLGPFSLAKDGSIESWIYRPPTSAAESQEEAEERAEMLDEPEPVPVSRETEVEAGGPPPRPRLPLMSPEAVAYFESRASRGPTWEQVGTKQNGTPILRDPNEGNLWEAHKL